MAAQVVVRNRRRGLTFKRGLVLMSHFMSSRLEGVAYPGDSPRDSLLAVANTSAERRKATVSVHLGGRQVSSELRPAPHQTRLLPLAQLAGEPDTAASGLKNVAVGISVEHNGAPGEVKHIDIRRLRDEQVEGESGALLPRDVVSGQAKVLAHDSPGENHKLVGEAVQIDAQGRMTGFLSCPYCLPDPSYVTLSPLSFTGDVGTSQQIWRTIYRADGTSKINSNPFAIDWYPSDASVATVSEAWSNFQVQFQSPGTAAIDATMPYECHYDFDYFTGEPCVCQYEIPVSTTQGQR